MTRTTLLALLTVVHVHKAALADQPNKVERVTYSSWTYTYTTPGGSNVNGECHWADTKGGYRGGSVNGKFADVSTAEQPGGTAIAKGKWQASGVSGTFRFTISSDRKSFNGSYTIEVPHE